MKTKYHLLSLACILVLASTLPSHTEGRRCADSDALCGPLSLLVVCQSLGVDGELDELRNLSGFDEKKGTTMLGLKKAAEANGLCAVGMKIGVDVLAEHSYWLYMPGGPRG